MTTSGSCGTILVVDHDEGWRALAADVVSRLGYRTCALESAELALAHMDDERLVLAILEVELPGPTSGFELLQDIHAAHGEELPVILVSEERTAPLDHVAGLLLGADDYVSKPFDPGELLARVRRSISRSAGPNGQRHGAAGNGRASLSPRELEILELLSHGLSQAEIARELVMSPKTAGTHIQHILSKLGVHSRAQAVAEAHRLGLATPGFSMHELVVDRN